MLCLVVLFDELSYADKLCKVIANGFKFDVKVVKARKPECLTRGAQLNADDMLAEVTRIRRESLADIALGLTESDLYHRDLNFVFGLASFATKSCIVSWHRLKHPEEKFFERLVKECLHELGHVFGLAHCQNRQCVMSFSNSLAEVDMKHASYCANCTKELMSYLRIEP
jgi:predicted Zn-dependent protease